MSNCECKLYPVSYDISVYKELLEGLQGSVSTDIYMPRLSVRTLVSKEKI